jgi:cytosine/adenosine deaminase-related metal-dependent hydrolase
MNGILRSWSDEWQSKSGCERVLRVRWLLNPAQPPLENVELIEQHGRIAEIRPLAPDARDVLPVIPTLVNAHTHLEFSSLSEPIHPTVPFQDWITAVIQWRRSGGTISDEAVQRGLAESLRNGVTAVGEITTTKPVCSDDIAEGCRVVSFREVIGLQQERIPELLQQAASHLSRHSEFGSDNSIVGGISPHAPYTVHPELFASLVELAVSRNAVVAMHLAETTDELELLHDGKGPFVEFLTRLGLWDCATFPGGRSIRDFLEQLARVPRALAIHGNYFTHDDIQFVARHANVATVFCPRTHAYFGHPPHPIQQLLAAGARVVLGTDSRASNPDLSLWKELQFVATHFPDISIPRLLAMATTDTADSLGLPIGCHQISAGAELPCVMLSAEHDTSDLRGLICHPSTQPTAVLIGERVFG